MKRLLLALSLLTAPAIGQAQTAQTPAPTPQYRPAYHFAPAAHWMNDPNGMVYLNGTYHLFFQYYPDGMSWGPMHWGHATSRDLLRWQEQPIALYPDKLGYIFSGSAVVDENNTAGFGKNALVAIFTHHDPEEEKKKTGKHETQSLAYSLDEGKTWTKYAGNPVLKNPGIPDFRDPKVSWNAQARKWIMTLATKDRITFYSSPNLKDWTKESEFGEQVGAHGGVWECPDLFPLTLDKKTYWVLLVNLNPGGPNGGSATQYFVGQFDGKTFRPQTNTTKWADYGPDEYAGVTFANTGNRCLFLGWMSNWDYAQQVPTAPWRSAMTLPRELGLRQVGKELYLTSAPVKEVASMVTSSRIRPLTNFNAGKASAAAQPLTDLAVKGEIDLLQQMQTQWRPQSRLQLRARQLQDMTLVLSNAQGEELLIGFDKKANQYFIDRSKAGPSGFSPKFAARHVAPRLSSAPAADLTLFFDAASVELFADGGLTAMTEIFFPSAPFTSLRLRPTPGLTLDSVEYTWLLTPTK
ncbi:glycoside hydrolase family 32 protein [Hymenobacter gummosus]|uniref:Glycoside hydrolase family 32 protein n=1 Tax=Hymenobacter gummosus TaxID=1776032 RepID=A0A3S0IPP6_9BACT|nr:glycoside hydrolase family 32 protein [Hymenobacter gummosus]RTQ50824.1 glycoside hydrolase family 32 protein [Hymenobacter gummosus]